MNPEALIILDMRDRVKLKDKLTLLMNGVGGGEGSSHLYKQKASKVIIIGAQEIEDNSFTIKFCNKG